MEHAASTDVGPQPSLDLPGRRKTRVGKLRLVAGRAPVIALGASGVTVYLQRLFQQHQDAKQAALTNRKTAARVTPVRIWKTQKDTYQARGRRTGPCSVGGCGRRCREFPPRDAGRRGIADERRQADQQTVSNQPRPLTPAERRLQGSVLVAARATGRHRRCRPEQRWSGSINETLDGNGDSSGQRPDGVWSGRSGEVDGSVSAARRQCRRCAQLNQQGGRGRRQGLRRSTSPCSRRSCSRCRPRSGRTGITCSVATR